MKALKLGIPYKGGKRQLSKKIIDFILAENPNCKYFYDLFGGGGAMSFEALQRPQIEKVFYNEIDTGMTELIKKIRMDGITPDFYNWVTREQYHALKNGITWQSGLIKTCWSFGNNGWTYIFGKPIEEKKRLLHEIIVNKCAESRGLFPLKFDDNLLDFPTVNERRLAVMSVVKKPGRFDMEQLERLERLGQLGQLEQLAISNVSYDAVKILTPPSETVIYLDPPYLATEQYQNKICHNALYEYINSSPYKIYMSSYDAPYETVMEITYRTKFCPTSSKSTIEKLYRCEAA